jgi:thioredoxin reductase (NADPH)
MANEYDVVVVGGGLAGLSAALASARLGLSCLIFTGDLPGGQLLSIDRVDGVPDYPGGIPGYELCPITQEQAAAAGVEFAMADCSSVTAEGGKWRVSGADQPIVARGLVIATGTSFAKLGVPGEDRFTGKGVSHCASCDGPLLRGRTAAVVGAGDSAMQEAITLAEHADKVIMIDRGNGLAGQSNYIEAVQGNGKIELRTGTVVTEVLGNDSMSGLRVKDVATGAVSEVVAAAMFAYVGLVPNNAVLSGLVALERTGRVAVDAALRSTARGICAAGNVRQSSPHRAAAAMSDGATAAATLGRYFETGEWRD